MASGATGEAAIGLVRLSGPGAVRIAEQLIPGRGGVWRSRRTAKPRWRSRRLYHERVVDPASGAVVDDVLLSVMRAPRSFTGQDVVELSGHAGLAVRELLRLAVAAGARPAERGEFTLRAYLAGKLDLAQAEAVADAVSARTPAALSLAVGQLGGTLSQRIGTLRGRLIALYARLEASIDFEEDEAPEVERDEAQRELQEVGGALEALLATARWGQLAREGIRVALVGRPNAGKSSLLNALLQADRAIVSSVPGTTRDVIEERIDLLGVPALLADTAGIGDSHDPVERLGVERSRRAIAAADLVTVVIDANAPLGSDDRAVAALVTGPAVVVLNKADLPATVDAAEARQLLGGRAPVVSVSAVTGLGLDALRETLARAGGWLRQGLDGETQAAVTSARHRAALVRAHAAVGEGAESLAGGLALDAVCTDVRSALEALGEITGESVTEDVLSEIFSRFCIGK
ncbi:MAG TPA: tRNA uridine-5-carboxymethylaminomethyl(34) synthesis GTPase MnmE [Chloroflexota bacterium]|nr:tRNA uridine-5-carboxymethylaminomethyl(34) synthesis GTPase MnmE [Chloroflexota bacterium]